MGIPDRGIEIIATLQHGLVTRAQALEAGLSPSAIARRVSDGAWESVFPGVYRIRPAPWTERSALLAAVLAAGPTAVASHRSAGWLWGMTGVAHGAAEVTRSDGGRTRLLGVECHRTQPLGPADVAVRDAIPVTSPARTLVDLGAAVSPYVLDLAFNDALRKRLCKIDDVERAYETKAARPGTAALRVLIETWRPGDERTDTQLESKALRALRRGRLPEPVKQHQVAVGREVFLIDLAYPEEKVGIELLGFEPHSTRRAFDRDPLRRNALLNHGWVMLEFTSRSPLGVFLGQVSTALSRRQRSRGVG